MPGNTIKINKKDDLEWYVGDSEIDKVIDILDEVGCKTEGQDKIIPISKEASLMVQLDQWLKELIFPGEPKDFFQEISGQGDEVEVKRILCFYTDEHLYRIVAIERDTEDNSYLGCQVRTRKARAGEDWFRGNDLPDGPFNKKTWDRIIYAIVSYEMVKLSDYQKPDEIPELVG